MQPYVWDSQSWLLLLFFHLLMAPALWKMADRVKEEPKWFAIVPILNLVLMLKLARRPMWWLILFLLPIVNLVALIAVTMSICERFGLNKWWGLVSVLSPFNAILFLYLAFGKKGPAASRPPAELQA